jgi:hypothetical protein
MFRKIIASPERKPVLVKRKRLSRSNNVFILRTSAALLWRLWWCGFPGKKICPYHLLRVSSTDSQMKSASSKAVPSNTNYDFVTADSEAIHAKAVFVIEQLGSHLEVSQTSI